MIPDHRREATRSGRASKRPAADHGRPGETGEGPAEPVEQGRAVEHVHRDGRLDLAAECLQLAGELNGEQAPMDQPPSRFLRLGTSRRIAYA
ncbi:hypothetical protein ACIO13_34015 [Streptomyces sp. NPDC087425]|uniref:hypothetical protein n=1 Tax=Streptomyces sp. NPDC087425 TaxID=3365787 RepID=UPI00382B3715